MGPALDISTRHYPIRPNPCSLLVFCSKNPPPHLLLHSRCELSLDHGHLNPLLPLKVNKNLSLSRCLSLSIHNQETLTLIFREERGQRERESMVKGGEEESWFIYSFVARGTMVLAEYTEFTGNFPAIAGQCLQKLPSSNNKFTYSCDHHNFNFLVHDGYAYCVVAKESAPKHVSIALLERLKVDFRNRYGGGKADTATAKSLNKEFGPIIKEHMQYIMEHADEIEKLIKVKAQVSEVKSIMLENIEKAVDRGEKLSDLADKTTDLHSQAQDFRKQGTRVRRKMWYKNMKIKLVVLAVLFLLILIIWVSVCGGFKCTKENNHTENPTPPTP